MENLNKEENQRINNAKELGFDTETVWYHVSNNDFDFFDIDKSFDGSIWLTKNLEAIKNGETGASISGDNIFIHEFYIKTNKIAGWNEYDNYLDDQIIDQGFDAILLEDDIRIFDADNIRKTNFNFEKNELKKKTKNKLKNKRI